MAPAVHPEQIGLSDADVLELEGRNWERMARMDRLDPQSRPLAVRGLQCRRDPTSRRHYWCDYTIDYGISGTVAGSLPRRNIYLGRNREGQWDFYVLVT